MAQSDFGNFCDIIRVQGEERRVAEDARIQQFAKDMPGYLTTLKTTDSETLLLLYRDWCGRYESHWRERKLMDKLRRAATAEILKRMNNHG